jgi:hypothetical protein
VILLYYCTTVLLYYCTTLHYYYYTTVLLYYSTTVLLEVFIEAMGVSEEAVILMKKHQVHEEALIMSIRQDPILPNICSHNMRKTG